MQHRPSTKTCSCLIASFQDCTPLRHLQWEKPPSDSSRPNPTLGSLAPKETASSYLLPCFCSALSTAPTKHLRVRTTSTWTPNFKSGCSRAQCPAACTQPYCLPYCVPYLAIGCKRNRVNRKCSQYWIAYSRSWLLVWRGAWSWTIVTGCWLTPI